MEIENIFPCSNLLLAFRLHQNSLLRLYICLPYLQIQLEIYSSQTKDQKALKPHEENDVFYPTFSILVQPSELQLNLSLCQFRRSSCAYLLVLLHPAFKNFHLPFHKPIHNSFLLRPVVFIITTVIEILLVIL
jgi:hypothetical protein